MSDLTRRHRLTDLEAQIRHHYAAAARNLWRTGRALAEVRDQELWRDGGYIGFDAWLLAGKQLGVGCGAARVSAGWARWLGARMGPVPGGLGRAALRGALPPAAGQVGLSPQALLDLAYLSRPDWALGVARVMVEVGAVAQAKQALGRVAAQRTDNEAASQAAVLLIELAMGG